MKSSTVAAHLLRALLMALPALSTHAALPMQPLDLFELQYPRDPQISPDGKRVAYTRRQANVKTDGYTSEIWVVDSDSGRQTRIAAGSSPAWSPDGTRLAYLAGEGGATQIFTVTPGAGEPLRLTNVTESASGIAWSTDGSRIAFIKRVPLDQETRPKPTTPPPEGAKWAPPGVYTERLLRQVEYSSGVIPEGYHHVFVIPAAGGKARQVTTGPYDHGGPLSSAAKVLRYGRISWAPDDRSIVMSVNRRPQRSIMEDPDSVIECDVYEFDVATGEARQLTNRIGPDSNAVVSPDGKWIAFIGFDNHRRSFQNSGLYVMPRQGGPARLVSDPAQIDIGEYFLWQPDSGAVLVTYQRQGKVMLARIAREGGVPEVLFDDVGGTGQVGNMMRGPSFSLSRDGRYAVVSVTDTRPDEIVIGSLQARDVVRVTGNNDALMAQREVGKTEEMWVTSQDGERIQAWLTYPPGYDSSKKYPLMLWIRGGPYSSWGPRFVIQHQLLAARGYILLLVNQRGSTGFGERFSELIHHRFPGDELYDFDVAVNAVIERGLADPRRTYVAGFSAGGVYAADIVGRTNRYAAAAILYPVTEWVSQTLTMDRPDYYLFYNFPAPPWEAGMIEHYWQRSPLARVGNVKTPSLLLCGEEDRRTPIAQCEMFYTALKLRGVESALVRFPDNNHTLADHPSHLLEVVDQLDTWFLRFPIKP